MMLQYIARHKRFCAYIWTSRTLLLSLILFCFVTLQVVVDVVLVDFIAILLYPSKDCAKAGRHKMKMEPL